MKAEIYRTERSRDILMEFCDGALQYWSYPHEKTMLSTQFGQTHVITAGSKEKPALVLLHGAASNILGWGAAIPEYMQDFFVIAPDIPGEAGKSAPVRPSWDGDDYILWLDDVLTALGVERAALLGLSFGGWIAAKYAAARPEKVSRIVLLAPGGIAPARTGTILKTVLYSMQKEKGAENEMKRIACPVLMMTGGEDAFFNARKAGARMKKLLPGADIRIDAKGKHGITQYGGGIAAFLAAE